MLREEIIIQTAENRRCERVLTSMTQAQVPLDIIMLKIDLQAY